MRAKDKSTNNNASGQLHLTSRFTSAIEYARILHIERRKGTDVPYMAHLLGVASLVMGEAGHAGFPVTEDMVIAALLHDAAEDQGENCGSRTSSTISARMWPAWSRDCPTALLRIPTTRNLAGAQESLYPKA
jgi:(p)ppGpp synthase/HD superfamily hydrolase